MKLKQATENVVSNKPKPSTSIQAKTTAERSKEYCQRKKLKQATDNDMQPYILLDNKY